MEVTRAYRVVITFFLSLSICFSGMRVVETTPTGWNSSVPIRSVDFEEELLEESLAQTDMDQQEGVAAPVETESVGESDAGEEVSESIEDIRDIEDICEELDECDDEYRPNMVERGLAAAYNTRGAIDNFVDPAKPHKESWWKKIIKAPFHIISAIASPVTWFSDTVTTPLMYRGVGSISNLAVKKVRSLFIPEEEYRKIHPVARQMFDRSTRQATRLITEPIVNILRKKVVDSLMHKVTYHLLKTMLPKVDIPKPKNYPIEIMGKEITYDQAISMQKDTIVKSLFKKYRDYLPMNHRRAFQCYKRGKKLYGEAQFVIRLATNVSDFLNTGYQLTGYAESEDDAPMLVGTNVKKLFMAADMLRCCADSYLMLDKRFNAGKKPSKQMKRFKNILEKFVSVVEMIAPWADAISGAWFVGKGLYEDNARSREINREAHAFYRQKYGMSLVDSRNFHRDMFKIGNPRVSEQNREKASASLQNLLKKYNLDFHKVQYDLMMRSPQVQNMDRHIVTQYQFGEDDRRVLLMAIVQNNGSLAEQILKQYNITLDGFRDGLAAALRSRDAALGQTA